MRAPAFVPSTSLVCQAGIPLGPAVHAVHTLPPPATILDPEGGAGSSGWNTWKIPPRHTAPRFLGIDDGVLVLASSKDRNPLTLSQILLGKGNGSQ